MSLIFRVALQLGLRRGELLGMAWRDLNWEDATIEITQQVQEIGGKLQINDLKTETSRRVLPIPPGLLVRLKAHYAEFLKKRRQRGPGWNSEGLVFPSKAGTPRRPSNLNRSFKVLITGTEFSDRRLHDLRHTFASILRRLRIEKAIIGKLLGHEQEDPTNLYAEIGIEMKREALEKLETALAGVIQDIEKADVEDEDEDENADEDDE